MSNLTESIKSVFRFRKDKNDFQRPTVEVEHPVPTVEGLVAYLTSNAEEHKKVKEMITDLVAGAIASQLRSKVEANLEFDQAATDELVNKGELSLEFIANIPKGDRNVLSKDDLEAFAKFYVEVMVSVVGLEQKKAENVGSLIIQRFNPVRGDVQLLQGIQARLLQFVEAADDAKLLEHETVLNYIQNRLDDLTSNNYTADAI